MAVNSTNVARPRGRLYDKSTRIPAIDALTTDEQYIAVALDEAEVGRRDSQQEQHTVGLCRLPYPNED
jgi:hypothetical protein